MHFRRESGEYFSRIRLEVSEEGYRQPDYGHGCKLAVRDGWNEGCEMVSSNLSLDELRDLRHMIDCALGKADV